MNLVFQQRGWDDYLFWQSTDKQILRKINALIKDIQRNPFDGIGKPEPLLHDYAGCWSRRIDREHRIIYEVTATHIIILQCRYHYQKN